jgi:hypothetical protein
MLKYVLDLKDLPEYLYKFRVFEDPNHKRILTDNEIFLPSPKRFNDPFDSTIPVRYDQGAREEIINHWVSHLKITRPGLSPQEMEAEATRLFESGHFRTPQSMEDIARISRERVYGTVGVFSLTANYENILLWSHYADKHRGFCIGFDARKLYLFCINYLKNLESRSLRGNQSIIFRDVRYTRNYPFINFEPWCQATVIRYWHGLTRDELRYILDPKDVYGPDFPGETFRVLKEKEEKQYGQYRPATSFLRR